MSNQNRDGNRWRRLKGFDFSHTNAKKIIICCCILHNLGIDFGDDDDTHDIEDDEDDENEGDIWEAEELAELDEFEVPMCCPAPNSNNSGDKIGRSVPMISFINAS